jgi:hypothetical protein
MDLEEENVQDWRYTLEGVTEQDWISTWMWSMDGAPGGETQFVC